MHHAESNGKGLHIHPCLFGMPGAGKDTQGAMIVEAYQVIQVVMSKLLQEFIAAHKSENNSDGILAIATEKTMKTGGLIDDSLVVRLLEEHIASNPAATILLNGFPRSEGQARALIEMFKQTRQRLLVLNLDLSEDEAIARLQQRADENKGTPNQRADDVPEIIRNRLEEYKRKTAPVVQQLRNDQSGVVRFLDIDAIRSPDDIFEEVQRELDRILPRRIMGNSSHHGSVLDSASVPASKEPVIR